MANGRQGAGDLVPPRIPGYRVDRLLGRGGMGAVWHARREGDGREVAVKVVAARSDERFVKRFKREIEVTLQLKHPNVVQVLDGSPGGPEGPAYLVLEYLEGRTVDDAAPLDEATAREVLRQGAEGLACLHGQGLVHRDVKPSNLFLTDEGRVVLLDFGLVLDDERTRMTRTDEVVGTPSCFPPEVLRGQRADARSDLYQLGVAVHYALTGDYPYTYEQLTTLGALGRLPPPPDPRDARPELGAGLVALVRRLMADAPARRPPSARALLDDLDRPPGEAAPEASTPPRRGLPAAVALLVFVFLAIALGALRRPPEPAPSAPAAPPRARLVRDLAMLAKHLSVRPAPPTTDEASRAGSLVRQILTPEALDLAEFPAPGPLGLCYLIQEASPEARSSGLPALDHDVLPEARDRRAFALFELLLERHGPWCARPTHGSLLWQGLALAVRAGALEPYLDRLRVLLSNEPTRAGRARAAYVLASGLYRQAKAGKRAYRAADLGLRLTHAEVPAASVAALREASAALEPLVPWRESPVPREETLYLYGSVLSTLGTAPARQAARSAMAFVGERPEALLQLAAASLSADGDRATPGAEEKTAALAAAERALGMTRDPARRARVQLGYSRLLDSVGRLSEALALMRGVRLEDLPRSVHCGRFLREASLLRRLGAFDEALAALDRAKALATTPGERAEFEEDRLRIRAQRALPGAGS